MGKTVESLAAMMARVSPFSDIANLIEVEKPGGLAALEAQLKAEGLQLRPDPKVATATIMGLPIVERPNIPPGVAVLVFPDGRRRPVIFADPDAQENETG